MTWKPDEALQDVADGTAEGNAEIYADLLTRTPVDRVDVHGSSVQWWGVFSHADITRGVKDFKSLSNVTPPPDVPRIIPLQVDPPQHTGYRKLLNPHFTAEEVGRLEGDIRGYATEMLDAMIARGTADFAEEFAFPFPTRVLVRFIGAKDADWTVHHNWVLKMAEATGHGFADPDMPLPGDLFGEIMPYLFALIGERRANPGSDVVSGIVTGEVGGEPINDADVVNMIITIMLAGHITTTSTIGNLVLRLARDQELQSFLRANPDRIPDAMDESLRIEGPQQAMPRKAIADIELGGTTIKAGQFVLLNYASANVDPAAYPEAGTYDIDRAKKRHFSFGSGLHQCIGRNLALLEVRIAVEELLARTESFELAGPIRRKTWPVMYVEKMPTTFNPVR